MLDCKQYLAVNSRCCNYLGTRKVENCRTQINSPSSIVPSEHILHSISTYEYIEQCENILVNFRIKNFLLLYKRNYNSIWNYQWKKILHYLCLGKKDTGPINCIFK